MSRAEMAKATLIECLDEVVEKLAARPEVEVEMVVAADGTVTVMVGEGDDYLEEFEHYESVAEFVEATW